MRRLLVAALTRLYGRLPAGLMAHLRHWVRLPVKRLLSRGVRDGILPSVEGAENMDRIRQVAAAFVGEWVVVRITRFDEPTTTPLDGEVVFHGSRSEDAYARAEGMRDRHTVFYVPTPAERAAAIVPYVHPSL